MNVLCDPLECSLTGTDIIQITNRQIAPWAIGKMSEIPNTIIVCDGSLAESRSHKLLRGNHAGSSHILTRSSALVFPPLSPPHMEG